MNFVGKICPYCKTRLEEGDDIVVCTICEMPHHKECWIENKACTTFGCTGTIMGPEQQNEEAGQSKFCTKCASLCKEGQKFCASCGARIDENAAVAQPQYASYAQSHQPYGTQQFQYTQVQNTDYSSQYYQTYAEQTMPDPDMQAFIAKNQMYYIRKFQMLDTHNSKASWNWASAFFGSYWFAYRKMYRICAAYCGISLFSLLYGSVSSLIVLALFVCSGIFGNYFYKQHAELKVNDAKSMDIYNKQIYIAKKGGTSAGAVWALIGIILCIYTLKSIIMEWLHLWRYII